MVAIAITETAVIHDSCSEAAAPTPTAIGKPKMNTRRNDANAAAFGPAAMKPVTAAGAPSYTSGVQT
jgi:hypothetical protein